MTDFDKVSIITGGAKGIGSAAAPDPAALHNWLENYSVAGK
jgi:hypothetical protein